MGQNTLMKTFKSFVGALMLLSIGCSTSIDSTPKKSQFVAEMKLATDHHSFSKPEEAITTHLKWDAKVDFDRRQITATATYTIQASANAIHGVTVDGVESRFELGPTRPFLGQPLSIPVTSETQKVSVSYTTSPNAAAFLWVEGDAPFLFTQSQAILARTWVPCQDSPGIRFTYEAHVEVPSDLMALMSAVNPTEKSKNGHYDL